MVVDRTTRRVSHTRFHDLPSFLRTGDLLVRNTARVLPARLTGQKATGGSIECLLLRPTSDPSRWHCLLRPSRRLPPGSSFTLSDRQTTARVVARATDAESIVAFDLRSDESVPDLAARLGCLPLPPYISRPADQPSSDLDRDRYQTVYASTADPVAVAAPTAGLHFTPELLARISALGIPFADLVLHVGLGTFRPISAERLEAHTMHRETFEIPAETRTALSAASITRRIAVGTTTLRTLEAFARLTPPPPPGKFLDSTDLFLYPPDPFFLTDALITNFHQPRSTLLCLVAAFLTPGSTDGIDWLHSLYREALDHRYRFLSYGDAMLIL